MKIKGKKMNDGLLFTPIEQWGKDHWSTFAYAETRAVDYRGQLDNRHMQCNPKRHPTKAHLGTTGSPPPTRLYGYFDYKDDPAFRIEGHDDWDCLLDAEHAGLLEIQLGSGMVRFTDLGHEVAGELRAHKAAGKDFAEFIWEGPNDNDEEFEFEVASSPVKAVERSLSRRWGIRNGSLVPLDEDEGEEG